MPDVFVTVYRSADPIEAEIVRDLLTDEGLDARVLGARSVDAAVWGSGAARIEARVDVRAAGEAQARRVIDAHLGEIRPAPAADSSPIDSEAPRLRALLAAGVVPIFPGGAHFYARRPLVAAAILAGQIAALAIVATSGGRVASAAGILACGLFVYDLVGGQLAVRAWNRGARTPRLRQIGHAALLFLGLGALAAAGAPMVARLHPLQRRGVRRSAMGDEIRTAGDPAQLPFPLHLDFTR